MNGAAALPRLVATTVRALSLLVRAESKLVVREAGKFGGVKVRALVTLGGAAVLGVIAVVFAALAAGAGLAIVLPTWAAALIVAGGLALVSAVLALTGLRGLKRRFAAPRNMVGRMKEDLRWVKSGTDR
jgi:hypothetical protein